MWHATTPQRPRELSRRAFLGVAAAAVAGCSAGATGQDDAAPQRIEFGRAWRVPAEEVEHRRSWMAWPSSKAIWGRWLPGVQNDIALIARTIARYEPVVMCARDADAARRARRWCGPRVKVIDDIPVDDCWMRDTGPVFRLSKGGDLGALGLGFNGWGGRQVHGKDSRVARRVARRVDARFERAGVSARVGESSATVTAP